MAGGWDVSVKGNERIIFDWTVVSHVASAELAPTVTRMLRAAAPVSKEKSDFGRLRDSIGYRQETGAGVLMMQWVSTAPYMEYVLKGTKGGQILQATRTQAMRWREGGAGYQFRMAPGTVTRGATKANPFNVKVIEEVKPLVKEAFGNAIIREIG